MLKNYQPLIFIIIFTVLSLGFPLLALAEDQVDCNNQQQGDCAKYPNQCFWLTDKCRSKTDATICAGVPKDLCGPNNTIGSKVCVLAGETCQAPAAGNTVSSGSTTEKPTGYRGALPDCAFTARGCRDVNNLLELVVNFVSLFFGILGAFAFVYFIYGGFTMITSFGNAEKVKKGRDTLVAAIIGLLICFVAYAAVKFMLDVLRVAPGFRGIN